MLSVKQVAQELGVEKHMVTRLIHTKKLPAINISPANKRPYWRIAEEILEQFKRGTLEVNEK